MTYDYNPDLEWMYQSMAIIQRDIAQHGKPMASSQPELDAALRIPSASLMAAIAESLKLHDTEASPVEVTNDDLNPDASNVIHIRDYINKKETK